MTRVLHLINTLDVGGGARHVTLLAAGLRSQGFESAVLAGGGGPAAVALSERGTRVRLLGSLDGATFLPLLHGITHPRPDLLHLHGSRSGLLGAIASRIAGVAPVVYTAHMFSFRRPLMRPLPWLAGRAESLTCRFSDRVICVSQSDREDAVARGLPAERITVIPNGIEMDRFPAATDRRVELGLDRAAPVVGMVGRLVEQKGTVAFAFMARRVAERMPEARFVVVGDGPSRAELEGLSQELIDAGRLQVTGFRDDVPELLATFDVVVFPSRWEAQGIGLIEAMASRRAVVATRLPAHAEAVVDGENGLLVPVEDPDAMADAVLALLRDRARREALAGAARRAVEGRYQVETMVASTAALYRELLASRAVFHAA